MNDNTLAVLEALAKKLGTTVEYLWPFLVKQAYVKALVYTCLGIFSFLAIIAIGFTFASTNGSKEDIRIGRGITIGVASLVLVCFLGNSLPGIFNPEGVALTELLNLLR